MLRFHVRIAALCICTIAAVIPAHSQLSVAGYNKLSASISSTGVWSVSLPIQNWKFGGSLGAPAWASLVNTGTDRIGDYQELAFSYVVSGTSRSASIRVYTARPVVLFSVTYNDATGNNTSFPTFTTYPSVSHVSYGGEFAESDFTNLLPDGPWVSFDNAANTFILSTASDFMTSALVRKADNSITAGFSSQIALLPAGQTHQTILTFGKGINQTFSLWGQAMTDLSAKQRPANDSEPLLKTVSYWTDNGATYYYNPGGSSYSGTLDSVKAEFDSKGIRLGSLQLDSWWYPKGPDNSWSSHSGIWTYTASTALFQPDLAGFRKTLGVPLITHARWIDANSPYRTQYAISGNVAIDPKYWEDIGDYLKASGTATYEQDWLGDNAHADFNLTDPNAFLGNMAASMAKRGLTIQYCMAEPKHFLQSTLYSNVTTVRTSQDRFGPERWTKFFYSSRFASAVGMWPFSDVFMSSELPNLIAATLSAGPLGLGDPVGSLSKENLLHSVRPDGVIVKPDVPATPLDSIYVSDAAGTDTPMIAAAYTDYGSGMKANYLFAYPRGSNTSVTIEPAALGITGAAYLYDYLSDTGLEIAAHSTWTLNLSGPSYFVLMPLGKTGIAFLGDKGHYVTLGKSRIPTLSDNGKVDLTIAFAPGETVRTLFGFSEAPVIATALAGTQSGAIWDPGTELFTVNVRPGVNGTAHLRFIQSFDPSGGSVAGCGFRCGGADPVPGPGHDK